MRVLLTLVGLACIVTGALVVGIPLYNVYVRGQHDSNALDGWKHGGSSAIAGAARTSTGATAAAACGSSSAADYALVTFPSLGQYGYAGVAGDGTWDQLLDRSMVHYATSPGPGEQGNSIIAFHREPDFHYIDQLKDGDLISVQDRACHTFQYRITQRWELDPSRVTQLEQTDGHDLTLITCTPWYQDTQRLVWRATLIG
ncbi:MAG: hypothetical protein NVSMB29_04650 [Candidatus Dormibacteria bacterium]